MGKRFIFLTIFFISCGFGHLSAQTYEEWIQKSCDYFDKNDLVSAEEALKNAMREEPGNPANFALLCNLGTIQRRQGKKQEALVSYTAALSRHPKSVTILENRASLYTELGEIDKAINDYNALLIVDPEHQESLYARGLLYLAQKNMQRQKETSTRSCSLMKSLFWHVWDMPSLKRQEVITMKASVSTII